MKSAMYKTIETCINNNTIKLTTLIERIREECWHGLITEAERDELIEKANQKAAPDTERPELLDMVKALAARVEVLEKKYVSDEDVPSDSAHSEWKPWDGVSDDYQKGAIVSYNGSLWESVYDGQNVWEPGVVDERFWKPYTE